MNALRAVGPSGQFKGSSLFVVGAGRSGTSLTAGLFRHNADLFMGDNLLRPSEANPLGYFEDREVNAINEDLLGPLTPAPLSRGRRWLACLPPNPGLHVTTSLRRRMKRLMAHRPFCFKDPRFCYTVGRWISELPSPLRENVKVICVFRNPVNVVTSVQKELRTAPYLRGLYLRGDEILAAWEAQYRAVLAQPLSSSQTMFVQYERLLDGDGLDRLASFTGRQLDQDFKVCSLNRSLAADYPLPRSCAALYDHLQRLGREV
jgi:hypothetical protein